jgi:hypothetical protein
MDITVAVVAATSVLVGGIQLVQPGSHRRLSRVLVAGSMAALAHIGLRVLRPASPSVAELSLVAAHLLLVTVAATFAFGLLRWITNAPFLLQWNPIALGSVVAILQLATLFAAYPTAWPSWTVLVISALWPAATVGLAAATVMALGEFARHAQQWGMIAAIAGCVAMGAGAVLGSIASDGSSTRWSGVGDGMSAVVGGTGFVMFAVGLKAPLMVRLVADGRRLFTAVRVLRRVQPLLQGLSQVAGQWIPELGESRLTRRPAEQACAVLVFVRDASSALQPLVDPAERDAAVQYARRYNGRNELAVAALAEACWLALAVHRFHAGHSALVEQKSTYLDPWDLPRDDTASVSAELAFLAAVARAWTRTAVVEAFVHANTSWPLPAPDTIDASPAPAEEDVSLAEQTVELTEPVSGGRHRRAHGRVTDW